MTLIMTLSIMALSITTLSITKLSTTTLSITTISITPLSINRIQHKRKSAWQKCHYAERHIFMPNAIMLSVDMLSVIKLSVVSPGEKACLEPIFGLFQTLVNYGRKKFYDIWPWNDLNCCLIFKLDQRSFERNKLETKRKTWKMNNVRFGPFLLCN